MEPRQQPSPEPATGSATESTRPFDATPRLRSHLLMIFLAIAIFGIAFVHYRSDVGTRWNPDESRWINRAHYIEDLRHPFGPTWNDNYLTRGQPPIGSYVMGIGLWIQGVDLDTNYAWEYRRSGDWNVQNGMYPDPVELRAGRMVNVFLGSIAVVVTFFVVRLLSNTAGGLVGAALLGFNPLQSWHNRLALADTTLTLTLTLIALMSILLLRKPGWFRAVLLGMLIGVGGANKLTPLALAFVLAAVGAIFLVLAFIRNRRALLPDEAWYRAIPGLRHLSWMLISMPLLAGAAFVAVYPYLWPDPITRTLLLVDFRRNEMDNQARIYPQFQVNSVWEAIERTWDNLAERWSATDWVFSWWGADTLGSQLASLDVILAIAGTAALLLISLRRPLRSGHLIVTVLLLVQIATIVVSMRTDFERYYLPIVLANAILAGSGVGIALRSLRIATQTRLRLWQRAEMRPAAGGAPRTGVSES